jgi:hypothetical protein
VAFTVVAAGGSGSYEYRFWLYSGGLWSEARPYGTSPTWTWNTTIADIGNHYVWVDVRNVGSGAAMEGFAQIPYAVNDPPLPSNVSLSAEPTGQQTAGASVIFTAAATGWYGRYEYRFWIYSGGTWSIAQTYGTSPTWTWNTSLADLGNHYVWVDVRNAGSAADVEVWQQIPYLVQ